MDVIKTFFLGFLLSSNLLLITSFQEEDIAFDEMPPNFDAKISNIIPVRRMWGISDTQAIVGKLFTLIIPVDAFKGDIDYYEVSMN